LKPNHSEIFEANRHPPQQTDIARSKQTSPAANRHRPQQNVFSDYKNKANSLKKKDLQETSQLTAHPHTLDRHVHRHDRRDGAP